jgi:hypothetical protein
MSSYAKNKSSSKLHTLKLVGKKSLSPRKFQKILTPKINRKQKMNKILIIIKTESSD